MARAVVAVHAVHPPALALRELLRRHALGACTRARCPVRSLTRTYGITWRLSSVAMYSISFATFMCQWMPVRDAEPLAAAADVHLQRGHRLGVLLVVAVLDDALDLVAVELLGPVALLAGVARRPQVLHRRRNRPRVGVEASPRAPGACPTASTWRTRSRPGRCGTATQVTRECGPSW